MAPRANKRTASRAPAEEPIAKRISVFLRQQGITKADYKPVVEAVQHPLSGLPEVTRQMVLAALPWSIAVPADERSAAQAAAVCMVGEILGGVQAELQKALDVEASKVKEFVSTKAELVAAAQQKENADAEARQSLEQHKKLVLQAEATTVEKRTAAAKIESEEKRLRAELEHTSAKVSELQEVVSGSFARLKDGGYEDSEAEGLVKAVMAVSTIGCLEDSLMLALPSSLAKRERGSFDEAVIGQAEQSFQGQLNSLRDSVEAAEGPLAEQVAASQMAGTELTKAMADQTQAEDELRGAQDKCAEAAAAHETAKCSLAQLEPELEAATAVQDAKSCELEQFRIHNMHAFNLLCDRVLQKSLPEAAGGSAADTAEERVPQEQSHEAAGDGVLQEQSHEAAEGLAADIAGDGVLQKQSQEAAEVSAADTTGDGVLHKQPHDAAEGSFADTAGDGVLQKQPQEEPEGSAADTSRDDDSGAPGKEVVVVQGAESAPLAGA